MLILVPMLRPDGYRISDESAQLVEWSDVKRCQAYLLFYEAL